MRVKFNFKVRRAGVYDKEWNRDSRIMGAKKIDFQKMGAAHCFFFGRPLLFFLFHGRRAHRAPISFFFWNAHYFQKKIMGNLHIDFFLFFYLVAICCAHRTFLKKNIWDKKQNFGGAPIVRPLFFFYFSAHYLRKKIMGDAPIVRPWVFFFPPMILLFLLLRGFSFLIC